MWLYEDYDYVGRTVVEISGSRKHCHIAVSLGECIIVTDIRGWKTEASRGFWGPIQC